MDHQYYMEKALELASRGWPQVAPNPMVGCVIVKNDKIVAEGYHEQFGGPHAEVNAIANLPSHISPSGCTLYVTLEPCTHFGKTPPCADLLIEKGFKNVVIACKDPNPLVAGKGVKKLRENDVTVETGVLEAEARTLNRRFITFFEKKRPYIILKWAVTADGFISRERPVKREDNLITGSEANVAVHQLRAETMAILVGKNTVLSDDPSLTARLVPGKNPMRLFIDGNLEVSSDHKILNAEAPTIVFNYLKDDQQGNITYLKINKDNVVAEILEKLFELKIQSLLVEGGTTLLQHFIDDDLWDEVLVFENPALFFGAGVKGPAFERGGRFEMTGRDKLFHHFR